MDLNKRLQIYRKEHHLSKEELAMLCGVSTQTLQLWEKGQTQPDEHQKQLLSQLLSVKESTLFPEEEACKKEERAIHTKNNRYGITYTSKLKLLGIPLVSICLGGRKNGQGTRQVAKGILAIGNTAVGFIAIGFMSFGVFSFGILSIGLFFALGCLAIGSYVIGALAIGYFSVGALSIGVYSIGTLSIGFDFSIGVLAYGHQAAGIHAFGDKVIQLSSKSTCFLKVEDQQWVLHHIQQGDFPFLLKSLLQHITICK